MPAYWTSPTGTTFSLCVWEAGWTSPTLDHSPHHASVHRETSGQGWGVPWLWPWECKFCGCCQALPPLEYGDGVCTFPVRPFICTGHRWRGWLTAQMGYSGLHLWRGLCPVLEKNTSLSLGSFYSNGLSFLYYKAGVNCQLFLVSTIILTVKSSLIAICREYMRWLFTCTVSLLDSTKYDHVLPISCPPRA